jgi:hypothetical protein
VQAPNPTIINIATLRNNINRFMIGYTFLFLFLVTILKKLNQDMRQMAGLHASGAWIVFQMVIQA